MSGRPAAIERRTIHPVDRPYAGALTETPHGPGVPVSIGPGETLWLHDPAWGRDLLTALTAAVQALEASIQGPTEPAPDLGGEPEPAVDVDVPETDAPADEPDPTTDPTDDTAQEVAHVH